MVYLDKSKVMFKRGEDGNLLPVDIVLETLEDKPMIKAIPITKGKLQEIFAKAGTETSKEQDNEIILNNCFEPKFTEEEIKDLKTNISSAIVTGILSLSLGMTQTDVQNKTKDSLNQTVKKQ